MVAFAIGGLLFVLHIFESNSTADAKEEEQIQSEANVINGHEYVDLGLSVKWATCNIGAESPEELGDYFAWGELSPKTYYDWKGCFNCLDNTGHRWGIYKLDGETKIKPESGHDTAREKWGGTWRMPTDEEFVELEEKCEWILVSTQQQNGYIVKGPNGQSIFLPRAGWYLCETFYDSGSYWSSTLSKSNSDSAHGLIFGNNGPSTCWHQERRYGRTIRAVSY